MSKKDFHVYAILLGLLFFHFNTFALVKITGKDTICSGSTVPLKGSVNAGTVISWKWVTDTSSFSGVHFNTPDTLQNITLTFDSAGTYYVNLYVTYSNNTVDSVKDSIVVIKSARAFFSTSVLTAGIPKTISFINSSLYAIEGYTWSFGDLGTSLNTNPTHTYSTANVYTVTLTAYGDWGCNDTLSSLLIISDTVSLSMPNVFTPNGDDVNDVFAPNAHGMKDIDCTIYDRWGAKIIDMDMDLQYWDGYTTSGEPCVAGTYFYVLKATDINGKTYSLKGYVQLIR